MFSKKTSTIAYLNMEMLKIQTKIQVGRDAITLIDQTLHIRSENISKNNLNQEILWSKTLSHFKA